MVNRANPESGDSIQKLIILIIGLFVLVVLVGLASPYLVKFWLWYAKIEGYLTYATTYSDEYRKYAQNLIKWTSRVEPNDVTAELYDAARNTVLSKGLHNYLGMAVLFFMSFLVWKKGNGYRGVPTLNSLLETEHKVWPALEFVKRFDPFVHWSETKGVGRYMVSPFVFCSENGILQNYASNKKKDRVFLDDVAVNKLVDVLGDRFETFSKMTVFEKITILLIVAKDLDDDYKDYDLLLGYFARHLANVKQPAYVKELMGLVVDPVMEFLDGVSDIATSNKFALDIIKLLKKNDAYIAAEKKKNPYMTTISTLTFIRSFTQLHAYKTTLIIGASRNVKRKGKFPSGRLVFLKPWDRRLFLLLNNSPYYVPENQDPYRFVSGFSAEVIGAFAHYQHEVFSKRALVTPYVETGVVGIKRMLAKQNIIDYDE